MQLRPGVHRTRAKGCAVRKRIAIPSLLAAVSLITLGGIWAYRGPIVTHFVDRTLRERGVTASYTIDHIGLGTQRLTNVRIGDAQAPDLTAREVDLTIDIGFHGASLTALHAKGVRANGRWTGERLTLGQVDKLLPADDGEPFSLPDIAVTLADASMRLDTPWGRVGLAVIGQGNVQRSFAGHVAVRAPILAQADCHVDAVQGQLQLAIIDGAPRIAGPVGFDALACPSAEMRLANARIGLTAEAMADLSHWSADARVRSGPAHIALADVSEFTGEFSVRSGDAQQVEADWQVSALQLGSPWLAARSLRVDGSGWRKADGGMEATGTIALSNGRAGQDSLRRFDALKAMDSRTPFGPLANKLGWALTNAGQNVAVTSRYTLANRANGGGMAMAFSDVVARAQSGARIRLDGDRAIGWNSAAGLSLSTTARIEGGGLPEGTVRLARRGDGAALSGEARLLPYVAGTSAVAVAPLQFVAASDGSATFSTGAALSGPLAGGFVDRLALPINGRIGPDGALTISGECRQLRWQRIELSGLRLDSRQIGICGHRGGPLFAYGPGGMRGGITLPAVTLTGSSGGSPMTLTSRGGEYGLGNSGFSLDGVDLLIGQGDGATRFAADRMTGGVSAGQFGGTLSGIEAKIGPVPLNLRDGAGDWRYANGQLSLDGRLSVTDTATDPRFQPMVTNDLRIALADGRVVATGALREAESSAHVADLIIHHSLTTGDGDARFTLPGLTFAREGLQPIALTNLAGGVIVNAEGRVSGAGLIEWDGRGVTSSGDFATDRLDFAAAFGPVQRLAGRIHFNDLLNLSTPPGQRATLGSVNPGVEVTDGQLLYQMLPGQQVRIESGRWPFAGGTLLLQPALLDFSADHPRRLTFDVEGVNAALFLQRYEFDNITASGVFDGVLPTVFDQDGGRVENGTLVSRDGGGELAYMGELSTHDLGFMANMAFGALKALRYDNLVVRLNGRIDGEMLTEVGFSGLSQGEAVVNNFITRAFAKLPFVFNIRINAPFMQLMSSARGLYDPTILVEQNLPALLRRQREQEAAAASGAAPAPGQAAPATPPASQTNNGPSAPVQPIESENRP